MNDYQVIINGTNLATLPNVELYNHDFNQLPKRQINMYKIARADLSIVTSSEYSEKPITVWLEVCGSSRSGTEATLHTIKSLIQTQNSTIRANNGGVTLEWVATLSGYSIEWSGITAILTLTFTASTPIGRSVSPVTAVNAGALTSTAHAFDLTIQGSAVARPIITIQYSAVSGGTNKTVTVQNNQTSQGIVITGDFATGDIIEIDSTNYIVRHNGVTIDYQGLFPIFAPGSRQLLYVDDFTSRTGTLTMTYNPRYA